VASQVLGAAGGSRCWGVFGLIKAYFAFEWLFMASAAFPFSLAEPIEVLQYICGWRTVGAYLWHKLHPSLNPSLKRRFLDFKSQKVVKIRH